VPEGITKVADWHAFYLDADLDFDLVGILTSILKPLAETDVSVFTLSTYSTDYILVRKDKLEAAKQALNDGGFKLIDVD
jgi:hypothetical protein